MWAKQCMQSYGWTAANKMYQGMCITIVLPWTVPSRSGKIIILKKYIGRYLGGHSTQHYLALNQAKLVFLSFTISSSGLSAILFLYFQLEEGEIDVRLNSFKGCFIQRSGRTRNWFLKPYFVSSLILCAKKVHKIHNKIQFMIMVSKNKW